jgi:chaperonin GroES
MLLKPVADRLLIKPTWREHTDSGLHLPTKNKSPERGVVLAVGPGKILDDGQRQSLSVQPGDIVIFERWQGHDVEVDSLKLLLLRECFVLAVLT